MEFWVSIAPVAGLFGLAVAAVLLVSVTRRPVGTNVMAEIAAAIESGAMAYLRRQYRILAIFVLVVAVLLTWQLGGQTGIAFVSGAACSALAGFAGMTAATRANVRTAEAARSEGQGAALLTAFDGGAVMGLAVASLGLVGVGLSYMAWGEPETASNISGFAMGASSIALFARVGGGIYTKAADVGADLVGKVEAGIPEDDPRNPGVIADNVGDNVGDVAGMGADIFESYVGSVIATIAIAATMGVAGLATLKSATTVADDVLQAALMGLPLAMAVVGLLASLVGIAAMRGLKAISPEKALRYSTFIGAGLFLLFAFLLIQGSPVATEVFFAVLAGTVVGLLIGAVTEVYTSAGPVRRIAEASKTGASDWSRR
jgi:K(+)-stimulated pyrophosphate-energized sodium pump